MPVPRSIDAETFLAYLRQSELFSPEECARLSQQYSHHSRGRALARQLIEDKVLTRFQAERLFAGRTAGFILGQYRILDQLGRGGMGKVYRAQHRAMRRQVALKVLAPGLLKSQRALDLFHREVRAMANLKHPNIVIAFDANEVEGKHYLVLEFVDGPNLYQLVRDHGRLPVGLACDYIRQAAVGLQHAHEQGMVHRDIKPGNILVQRHGPDGKDTPGLVKVSDFGLARLAIPGSAYEEFHHPTSTLLAQENTVMGTPDYLSPEQGRNFHQTDIRSDLYSLGCTFYFLLTGQVPFPGGTSLEKMIRHATEQPPPLSDFRSDVPSEVKAILDRMMAKNPKERFQKPTEVVEALAEFAIAGLLPGSGSRSSTAEMEAWRSKTESLGNISSIQGEVALSPTLEADRPSTTAITSLTPQARGDRQRKQIRRVLIIATVVLGLMGLILVLARWLG